MGVQKLIAVLMLACFGVLLPTAAASVRVCLLEERVLIAELGDGSACCSDCSRETEERDPCCLDLEALPDSSVPEASVELPAALISDLPQNAMMPPMKPHLGGQVFVRPEAILGRASPAAYRAVLNQWRL